MITGFFEPSSGTILFDKIPLQNIDKQKLRNSIGLYLEDMKIIQGTVKENILLGNTESTTEDILELSEQIGIENISSVFSSGFFTEISETDSEVTFSSRKKTIIAQNAVGRKKTHHFRKSFRRSSTGISGKNHKIPANEKRENNGYHCFAG